MSHVNSEGVGCLFTIFRALLLLSVYRLVYPYFYEKNNELEPFSRYINIFSDHLYLRSAKCEAAMKKCKHKQIQGPTV